MKLVVVTPIGPGHESASLDCAESVAIAWDHSPGPFTSIVHDRRDDTKGELGRSRARNETVASHPDTDWFLFVDADDLLHSEAFAAFDDALYADKSLVAVFGAVATDTLGIVPENVYPLDWRTLLAEGPRGTLGMGCFVRGDAARAVSFNESMDAAEDFDWYLRLLHNRRWTKVKEPLVTIRRQVPSATGPRGYADLDWREACQAVVDKWKKSATGSPYSPLKVFHHADRLKVLREGGQPSPTQVQLVISDYCNESCDFCAYRWEGYSSNQLFHILREDGTQDNNPKRMIPHAKIIEILDDCVEMGVKAIQITGGGEPTVHPDHAKVFRAVLDRGLDLALVTNGVVMRDGVPELLANAKWVRVSVDAGNAKTYATMRRVAESYFGRVWANIKRLCAARDRTGSEVVIGVGFVVTKDNWQEVLDATRMAQDAGADNIRLSAVFQPDDERYFEAFYDEARYYCREAEGLADGRFKVFNNFGDRIADLQQHKPDYEMCGYQHFSTYIGATQQVFRCCVLAYNERGLIGSIKDQRFKDLWASQAKRDDFAKFDARGCDRCMFNNKNRTINYALANEPAHVNFV